MTNALQRNLPAEIPPEIDRWNWGAFLLNWIWGVGNGVFISLLVFIPFFGILIMPFVLGAKGSAWAWRKGRWDSVEHFRRVQRLWAIWGAVIWVGAIVFLGATFGGLFYMMDHSDAYRLGVAKLQASSEVVNALGEPISTSFPMGNISIEGDSGHALLTFSATGPKGSGAVALEAVKTSGVWSIKALRLKVDGRDDVIDVLHPTSAMRESSLDARNRTAQEGGVNQPLVTRRRCRARNRRSRCHARYADHGDWARLDASRRPVHFAAWPE